MNQMKAAKTLKKIKRNAISTTKKILQRKGNSITPAQTNAPISQTSSEGLKLRNKELKMKLQEAPTSRGNIKSIFAS